MRFALSEEQAEFRDLTRELLAAECPASVVRGFWTGDGRAAVDRVWTMLAELGVTGLLVPSEHGGLGLDETYLVPVLTEAGYAGLPGPLVETVAVGAPTLPTLAALPDGQLESVLAGTAWVAVDVDADGLVPHAEHAAVLFSGGWAGRVPVRVAAAGAPSWTPVRAVDRTRELVRLDPAGTANGLADTGLADTELTRFWHRGVIGTAALLLGLATRMLDLTVAYVRDRQQFGVPVGSFQAVRHRLADVRLAVALAEPAVRRAGYSVATSDPEVAAHVSMAKVLAGEAAVLAAKAAIQCHGAMGYTEESDLHLFAKRAFALSGAWGSTTWHRGAVADELALPASR